MATQAQIDELLAKMAAERERLLSLVQSLSEEEAERTPVDGEGEAQWSAKQQLAHLAEMETAYRAWIEHALQEDGADVSRVRGVPPAIPLERAHEHTVADHVAELQRQRDLTLALIAQMRPEDFDRTATQAMFGTLTVLQWLRSYYRHDRMHIDQIRGREPEYKPRFAGGREPDQRR
jgi:hypothetical protein